MVYVAFSGGKDSTVLLDIVWQEYPDVPAVFANTGNELNSVIEFVKTYGEKIIWVDPKITFDEIVNKYGYPVVSKDVSKKVHEAKTTKSTKLLDIRLNGYASGVGKIPEKWKKLIDAPFGTTSKCCGILKGAPSSVYGRATGRKCFVGVMADESQLRRQSFILYGCNAFGKKDPDSRPLIFWTEQDVLNYIEINNIKIAEAYGGIIRNRNNELACSGQERTGCKLCLFGIHLEKGENRIQRLARTEPETYRHAIEDLGYDKVMEYIGVEWRPYMKDIQMDMIDSNYEEPA